MVRIISNFTRPPHPPSVFRFPFQFEVSKVESDSVAQFEVLQEVLKRTPDEPAAAFEPVGAELRTRCQTVFPPSRTERHKTLLKIEQLAQLQTGLRIKDHTEYIRLLKHYDFSELSEDERVKLLHKCPFDKFNREFAELVEDNTKFRLFHPKKDVCPEQIHLLCTPKKHIRGIDTFDHPDYADLVKEMENFGLLHVGTYIAKKRKELETKQFENPNLERESPGEVTMAEDLAHFDSDTKELYFDYHLYPSATVDHVRLHIICYYGANRWHRPHSNIGKWNNREYYAPIHRLDDSIEVSRVVISWLAQLDWVNIYITGAEDDPATHLVIGSDKFHAELADKRMLTCGLRKNFQYFKKGDPTTEFKSTPDRWTALVSFAKASYNHDHSNSAELRSQGPKIPRGLKGSEVYIELIAVSVPMDEKYKIYGLEEQS